MPSSKPRLESDGPGTPSSFLWLPNTAIGIHLTGAHPHSLSFPSSPLTACPGLLSFSEPDCSFPPCAHAVPCACYTLPGLSPSPFLQISAEMALPCRGHTANRTAKIVPCPLVLCHYVMFLLVLCTRLVRYVFIFFTSAHLQLGEGSGSVPFTCPHSAGPKPVVRRGMVHSHASQGMNWEAAAAFRLQTAVIWFVGAQRSRRPVLGEKPSGPGVCIDVPQEPL